MSSFALLSPALLLSCSPEALTVDATCRNTRPICRNSATSGLRTDLTLLNSGIIWAWVICVMVVAFSGKFLGSAIAARMSGFGWRQSGATGALMSAKWVGFGCGCVFPSSSCLALLICGCAHHRGLIELIVRVVAWLKKWLRRLSKRKAPTLMPGHAVSRTGAQPRLAGRHHQPDRIQYLCESAVRLAKKSNVD